MLVTGSIGLLKCAVILQLSGVRIEALFEYGEKTTVPLANCDKSIAENSRKLLVLRAFICRLCNSNCVEGRRISVEVTIE